MVEQKQQTEVKKQENKMRQIRIEKVVLSIGATAENLEKGFKLLERLSGKKPVKKTSHKRIPGLNVRPGLEVGCMVTLRGKQTEQLLKRLLESEDNQIKQKQISENTFSFGIPEYIEIPGIQYQRDIGIIGLDVTVTFSRKGKRIVKKRIKKKKRIPKKQHVSPQEIASYLQNKFQTNII